MPSSADVESALASAADAIVAAADAFGAPVILIDGRSGAGKTTLAQLVSARIGAQLLALDSVYPGWDGLAAGAEAVRAGVLDPLSRGARGRWRRWDWQRDEHAEEHQVEPHRALVVEGSGVLTADAAAVADVTVWLESPAASRRDRALRRDGEGYRPRWERWSAQEEEHLRTHRPDRIASIVVDVP